MSASVRHLPEASRIELQERLLKRELSLIIKRTIQERGLNQKDAAAALGIHQPKVSILVRGKLESFSVGKLIDYIVLLGLDVSLHVSPREATQAAGVLRLFDETSSR